MPSTLRTFLATAAIALWIGGLTFYAAFVVPIGTQLIGSVEQGAITQAATNRLNLIGVVALGILAWNAWCVRSGVVRWTWSILVVVQFGLFVAHVPLDRLLDVDTMTVANTGQFYAQHRIYLALTTIQWLAGVVHLWGIVRHSNCDQHSES